jgi:hypothetical protein
MLILCLQVVSWELAQPCYQHCTYSYLVDIVIFCLWMLICVKGVETCEFMEFVYVLEKRLGRQSKPCIIHGGNL